ncbi:unnamed protein product, partial [Meganyctiphanes norvegica]
QHPLQGEYRCLTLTRRIQIPCQYFQLQSDMTVLVENITTSSQTNITLQRQMSWDQLLLEIQSLFSTTYSSDLPTSFELSLSEMTKRASSSHVPSNKLYNFSMEKKQQKLVRIVTQSVPDGIFPKQYTAKLYDIKVGGQGPDDKIYNQKADIRKFIPRG